MWLPVFPLGSVLLPGMPLALRVFEPRYLTMLRETVAPEEGAKRPSRRADLGEFGVVLIERGHEVGGGETRFGVGTLARIGGIAREGGFLHVVARGTLRFEVDAWLPDEPYPCAEVHDLSDLGWDEGCRDLLAGTERVVRQALARAAPITELDRLALLRAASVADLLDRTAALVRDAW